MNSRILYAWGVTLWLCASAAANAGTKSSAPSKADLQEFDENTSFSEMLSKKQEIARSPASIEPLARVIGLRRELGLSDAESASAMHDIILNGGTNSGLSEGMTLSVVRKVPIIDPYRENAQSELEVEFARVKVVHVQKEMSVARLEKMEGADKGLFLGTRGILVGDFVTRSKK